MTHSLKDLPIGVFGAVMGLAGLGLTARAAAPLFPGVFRAPAYFTEAWVGLGVLAFLLLLGLYLMKIARHFREVKAEFSTPATLGFRAALPVGTTLVAGGLAPYLPGVADALWWCGVGLLVAFQVWSLGLLATRRVGLGEVNPGWLILFVGGIVVPGSGIALGHIDASRAVFLFSCMAAPLVIGALAWRAATGPLAPALRPSWFILLVPPSLISAHGAALFGERGLLELLFFSGIAILAALLLYLPRLRASPFSPVWWSLTFPLDAFAYAAARYAQSQPGAHWKALAGAALVLATLCVALVLLKHLHWIFARPRSAASQAG